MTLTSIEEFKSRLGKESLSLKRNELSTIQVNIGKLCNQACTHCHVGAGPAKTRENMDRKTVDQLLKLIKNTPTIKTVDITGGAPELNANFRHLVSELFSMNIETIDRCNLTVLSEPNQETTPQFLADHKVKVVASMPCYSSANVDKQRGDGVFDKSIVGLQKLNALGYGQPDSDLLLDLVYNPLGPYLPPAQKPLELEYKQKLQNDFGIKFNQLYCITNLPVKRFKVELKRDGKLDDYMQLLSDSFNPEAAQNIMCKDLISISWDGKIYDCDFNQMLSMEIDSDKTSIFDIESFAEFEDSTIKTASHCYGCTAGAGSSCSGTTI